MHRICTGGASPAPGNTGFSCLTWLLYTLDGLVLLGPVWLLGARIDDLEPGDGLVTLLAALRRGHLGVRKYVTLPVGS